jgi:hypothetical protein
MTSYVTLFSPFVVALLFDSSNLIQPRSNLYVLMTEVASLLTCNLLNPSLYVTPSMQQWR